MTHNDHDILGALAIPDDLGGALGALFEAVELILETCRYPDAMDPADPVVLLHPDALIGLEDAYDRTVDALIADEDGATEEEP